MKALGRHVVMVHPSNELYGSDRSFVSTVAALQKRTDVRVYLPTPGALDARMRKLGIPVCHVAFPVIRRASLRPARLPGAGFRLLFSLLKVIRLLARDRPAAIYVNTIICPQWIFAARILGVPSILHVREVEAAIPRLAQRVLLFPCRLAVETLTNSDATRAWVLDISGASPSRVATVYNGIDGPRSLPEGDRAGLVLVGRISHRKGQDVALEALHILATQGRYVELDIVGGSHESGEDYGRQIRRQAKILGLSDRVRFVGEVDDVGAVLHQRKILLAPSRQEPFGNVAVEGGLYGAVVIASDVEGLSEIVIPGVTGLLVPPDDPSALAVAISRLLDHPSLLNSLREAAFSRAKSVFSPSRYDREIQAAFDRVTGAASSLGRDPQDLRACPSGERTLGQ